MQISKALCIPPTAVLGGLVVCTSYMISPATVKVPGTEWSEKSLVWLSINMPTGSTKSALYQYLYNIIVQVREKCKVGPHGPAWFVGDATCEKMGDLMAANGGRLLGLYDELSTFLSQLNLYRGKGLNLSHELALFLQLYNGHSWTRSTGIKCMLIACMLIANVRDNYNSRSKAMSCHLHINTPDKIACSLWTVQL